MLYSRTCVAPSHSESRVKLCMRRTNCISFSSFSNIIQYFKQIRQLPNTIKMFDVPRIELQTCSLCIGHANQYTSELLGKRCAIAIAQNIFLVLENCLILGNKKTLVSNIQATFPSELQDGLKTPTHSTKFQLFLG